MKIVLRTRQDLKEPKLLAILLSSNPYFSWTFNIISLLVIQFEFLVSGYLLNSLFPDYSV